MASTFRTCAKCVTQPGLNPSSHGPTWTSEWLTSDIVSTADEIQAKSYALMEFMSAQYWII